MAEVRFTIPGEPAGKGRHRDGKGRHYTPEKTVRYENLVCVEYQAQSQGLRFPDDAMLDMRVIAYFRIPKSRSKKQQDLMRRGLIRPTKKPDMDNMVKSIADALNQVAYRDDTQIVDCQVRKFYADVPRVEVFIQQIGGE